MCPLCELFSNAFVGVLGANRERDSATRGKLCGDNCLARCAGFDEIVKDAVRDSFVERVLITIRSQIEFQRFAFNARPGGHVIDVDSREIRLACYRANGSEIVSFKMNSVIALRCWIRKRLQSRSGG